MDLPKLQQTVSGSYFVTIPVSWVASLNWNKGIDIVLKPEKNGVSISKAKVQRQKQVRKERKVSN